MNVLGFFFLVGEREGMHHAPSALLRRVWDSPGVVGGPHARWATIPKSYPLKTFWALQQSLGKHFVDLTQLCYIRYPG